MTLRFFLMAAFFTMPLVVSAAERPNYAGRYVLATPSPDRVFKLSLTQDGSRVHAIFFAADLAAAGATPTGEGDGRVTDEGVLEIKFKDNLANKGTATLSRENNVYRFEMRVTKITDVSPLHFYGVLTMRKIGDPLPSQTSAAM